MNNHKPNTTTKTNGNFFERKKTAFYIALGIYLLIELALFINHITQEKEPQNNPYVLKETQTPYLTQGSAADPSIKQGSEFDPSIKQGSIIDPSITQGFAGAPSINAPKPSISNMVDGRMVDGRLLLGTNKPLSVQEMGFYIEQQFPHFPVRVRLLIPLKDGPVFLLECNSVQHPECAKILLAEFSNKRKHPIVEQVQLDRVSSTQK